MSRKKTILTVYRYLAFLLSLFLLTIALLFMASPPMIERLILLFVLLFLCASVLMARWAKRLEQNLSSLGKALENIASDVWELPLPSSEIEEIWGATLILHGVRERLHEKFLHLEGEKEKLAGILSNLREGILVSDSANRITVANESAGNLLRTKASGLIGKSLDTLLEGAYKPIFESLVRGEEKSETLFIDSEATIRFRPFLLKNADESLIAKVCVLYDITESKKLEEMRRAFVANASHELRSPAAGLQALLDALEAGGLDDPIQRKKFLGMMSREISRLNAIIRDLLDLSELEREKEFSRKPLDMVKHFQTWLETYEAQLREKNIQIHSRFERPSMTLVGSEEDIQKLFRNLLENAIKYTPPGGAIEVGLSEAGGHLLGWVKDTGIGIAKEHLGRIFERFYRVDQSRSRALGGTGLGLSIAKHAVDRHGGEIWVESEEDKGSTFFFKVPLSPS